jgi:ATP-dependent DNA helicase PIF1
MFLTGCAGTGKSFLLGHILKRLRRIHRDPDAVAVTASTGSAAPFPIPHLKQTRVETELTCVCRVVPCVACVRFWSVRAGVAACNIGGVTLHRWTGIGLGDESIGVMVRRAFGKKEQWRKARVLIIDEISMVRLAYHTYIYNIFNIFIYLYSVPRLFAFYSNCLFF